MTSSALTLSRSLYLYYLIDKTLDGRFDSISILSNYVSDPVEAVRIDLSKDNSIQEVGLGQTTTVEIVGHQKIHNNIKNAKLNTYNILEKRMKKLVQTQLQQVILTIKLFDIQKHCENLHWY